MSEKMKEVDDRNTIQIDYDPEDIEDIDDILDLLVENDDRDDLILTDTGEFEIRRVFNPDTDNKYSTLVVKHTLSDIGEYDIWISNVQKCIRRGLVDEAIYSFIVVAGMGSQYTSNMMNRVFGTIISEDLFGNHFLVLTCADILDAYHGRGNKDAIQFVYDNWPIISDTIYSMCKGYKSRINDLQIHYLGGNDVIEITSFDLSVDGFEAIIRNIVDGKRAVYSYRGTEYNLNDILSSSANITGNIDTRDIHRSAVGKLSRKKKIQYLYFARLLQMANRIADDKPNKYDQLPYIVESLMDIYGYTGKTSSKLSLFHAFTIVILCDQDIVPDIPVTKLLEYDKSVDDVLKLRFEPLIISIDMHTKLGKRAKIGLVEFYTMGAKITNVYPPTRDFEIKMRNDLLAEAMQKSKTSKQSKKPRYRNK